MIPKDIGGEGFRDLFVEIHSEAELDKRAKISLVGFMGQEEQEEQEATPTLDEPDDDDLSHPMPDLEAVQDAETALLEEIPLPGVPKQERERREK